MTMFKETKRTGESLLNEGKELSEKIISMVTDLESSLVAVNIACMLVLQFNKILAQDDFEIAEKIYRSSVPDDFGGLEKAVNEYKENNDA